MKGKNHLLISIYEKLSCDICVKGNLHLWICISIQSIGDLVRKVDFTFEFIQSQNKWILKGDFYKINWNYFSDKTEMVKFTSW